MESSHRPLAFALASVALLSACVPVNTLVNPPPPSGPGLHWNDGLVYRMPLQAITVTLTVKKATNDKDPPVRSVAVDVTKPYPDMQRRYKAQFRSNQVSKSSLQVTVLDNGLLDGPTASTLTPRVSEILSGVAGLIGTFSSPSALAAPAKKAQQEEANAQPPPECTNVGVYSWIVEPVSPAWLSAVSATELLAAMPREMRDTTRKSPGDIDVGGADKLARLPADEARLVYKATGEFTRVVGEMAACNLLVKIDPIPTDHEGKDHEDNLSIDSSHLGESRVPGFFYRQGRPFWVAVTDTSAAPSFSPQLSIVSLPTRASPIEFLPIERSLLATNTFNVTFKAGSPTNYTQDLDSEWLGAVTIPAAVISSYFEAIGNVFKERAAANTGEQQYYQSLYDLAKQQVKTEACLAALKSNSPDQIKSTCQ